MQYYGFMVSELTGEFDDLKCNCEWKPPHETCGLSFAKWFETKEKRDKTKRYIINQIKKIQGQKRGKISYNKIKWIELDARGDVNDKNKII